MNDVVNQDRLWTVQVETIEELVFHSILLMFKEDPKREPLGSNEINAWIQSNRLRLNRKHSIDEISSSHMSNKIGSMKSNHVYNKYLIFNQKKKGAQYFISLTSVGKIFVYTEEILLELVFRYQLPQVLSIFDYGIDTNNTNGKEYFQYTNKMPQEGDIYYIENNIIRIKLPLFHNSTSLFDFILIIVPCVSDEDKYNIYIAGEKKTPNEGTPLHKVSKSRNNISSEIHIQPRLDFIKRK